MENVPVCRREGEEANMEWIPEDEIQKALKRVLENHYATARKTWSLRLLGYWGSIVPDSVSLSELTA